MSVPKNNSNHVQNEENGPSKEREKLDHVEDVNIYSQTALKGVLDATRHSNFLPTGDDYDFYSTFRSVRDVLDIESQRILSLIDSVFNQQCVKGKVSHGSAAVEMDDKFDLLTEANDHILERIGNNLDEASGIKKTETKLLISSVSTKSKIATSWNKRKESATSFRLLAAKNTPRPQFKFKDKVDNSYNPFIPWIKHKPNALMSLEESLKLVDDSLNHEKQAFPHPYKHELDLIQPADDQLEIVNPQKPSDLSETPLMYIDTIQDLQVLLSKLKLVKEIAIDLEAHSYRTYQGFTCLMQISTRREDFLVDTLALRSDLGILNEVFTNSSILKVLHGADMDILWLQRDLGLYIVNMFDTGQAARVLNLSRLSLAYLLEIYCQVEAEKQYQLADWRIRPLPQELVTYARTDTHYLLFIYDKLRNELLENGNDQKNLIHSVYDRSRQICLKIYSKHVISEDSYLELYRKSKKVFDSQQLSSLKQLYDWRDKISRVEDESTGYVLPNHMLLQIASILPRERQGILACCNPIPPIVRQYLNELHTIVLEARNIPVLKKAKSSPTPTLSSKVPTYGNNTSIYCPHDLTEHSSRHFIPRLDSNLVARSGSMFQPEVSFLVTTKPIITAFRLPETIKTQTEAMKKATAIKSSLEQPFAMFLPGLERKSKNTWLLKPSTVPSTEVFTSSPEYIPPKRKQSPKKSVPLRHQASQEKRPKHERREVSKPPVLPEDKMKRKQKKKIVNDNFKPFDYSNADKSIFDKRKK